MRQITSKKKFWRYVNAKLKNIIHNLHVFSVICILFEEMAKDLKEGKEIKIANFGTLDLKKMPARKYHDVRFNKLMETPGNKSLKFYLNPRLRKKLTQSLDLDKLKNHE